MSNNDYQFGNKGDFYLTINENRIFEADDSLFIDWRGKLSGKFPKLGLAGSGQRIIGIGAKSGRDGALGISFCANAENDSTMSRILV